MEYTLIYKTREFASLLKKEAVSDTDLVEALELLIPLVNIKFADGTTVKNNWVEPVENEVTMRLQDIKNAADKADRRIKRKKKELEKVNKKIQSE